MLALVLQLLPFILIFYFLLIRPQKKQQKQIADMLDALKKGDEIVTVGGVVGTIVRIKDNDIIVETGFKQNPVQIKFQKAAVGKVLKSAEADSPEEAAVNKDTEFED